MTTNLELIDIGANLSHDSFTHDLTDVIESAQLAGLKNIILTGTCVESSRLALQLSQQQPEYFYCTAGIHPHDASKYTQQAIADLKELAQFPGVKAIGETGLDFNRDFSPRDQQKSAFAAQLALATELQLPVFLHQRDAHEHFQAILRDYRDALCKGVVHCFTGSREELYAYLDMDMHIGITGWICDERRGQHLHELVKEIPANRLMIETDSPYLLPRSIKPKPKSRRNTPANLLYVLSTVAECLGKPILEVAQQTTRNAEEFFAL